METADTVNVLSPMGYSVVPANAGARTDAVPADMRRERARQIHAAREVQARPNRKASHPTGTATHYCHPEMPPIPVVRSLYGEILRTPGGNVRPTARFYELEHAAIGLLTHANPRVLIMMRVRIGGTAKNEKGWYEPGVDLGNIA